MTDEKWERGKAHLFWAEDKEPEYEAWTYTLDFTKTDSQVLALLRFLNQLKIIQYGCVYEQIDMIRIKVR